MSAARAFTAAGWVAFVAAVLGVPFLMPPGRVNGLAIVSAVLVLVAGALITRGQALAEVERDREAGA